MSLDNYSAGARTFLAVDSLVLDGTITRELQIKMMQLVDSHEDSKPAKASRVVVEPAKRAARQVHTASYVPVSLSSTALVPTKKNIVVGARGGGARPKQIAKLYAAIHKHLAKTNQETFARLDCLDAIKDLPDFKVGCLSQFIASYTGRCWEKVGHGCYKLIPDVKFNP